MLVGSVYVVDKRVQDRGALQGGQGGELLDLPGDLALDPLTVGEIHTQKFIIMELGRWGVIHPEMLPGDGSPAGDRVEAFDSPMGEFPFV